MINILRNDNINTITWGLNLKIISNMIVIDEMTDLILQIVDGSKQAILQNYSSMIVSNFNQIYIKSYLYFFNLLIHLIFWRWFYNTNFLKYINAPYLALFNNYGYDSYLFKSFINFNFIYIGWMGEFFYLNAHFFLKYHK